MISQTVEYALRAIVTIAQHDGKPCTSAMIAEITQVPSAYLSKLMQGLVRGGLVNSQRGLHGGFVLAKNPADLTIYDVVESLDPIKRFTECPLGIQAHGATLCPLHRRLDQAMQQTEDVLRATTISEMLAQPDSVTPLCEENRVVQLTAAESRRKRTRK